MKKELKHTGYPSNEDLASAPGIPSLEYLNKKTLAVIECFERIPCNPCEKSCPFGAITIGEVISNLPAPNPEKCKGCCACITHCPGLAIFVVDMNFTPMTALVKIPYELFPVPIEGDEVKCLNRKGEAITTGRVHSVKIAPSYNKTYVIGIEIQKEFAMEVRNIQL
jgi:Fe-S-cluster-containing hydrogenase component 2